jgi:sugar phosphate isomerase/epimerase
VSRQDIIESYRLLAPNLVHIHLSDNAQDGRDGHLELEQGKLPLDRFLGELRKAPYAGVVSLELSVRRYTERHKDLVAMLTRNREYVERKLVGGTKVDKGLPRGGQAGAAR